MDSTPPHIDWLKPTGEIITTAEGSIITLVTLNHLDDKAILSPWAAHFRRHYCDDAELATHGDTGLSKAEYLKTLKFPDPKQPPGPATRSGDFAEILVADYIEYRLGYWCPREYRYRLRDNPNSPTQGTDVLGFKFAGQPHDDELFLLETKAALTATKENRLQTAVDHSAKDKAREAVSLNALKQRLLLHKQPDEAARVRRFQEEADRPFKRVFGAAAVLDSAVKVKMDLAATTTTAHPAGANLVLIVVGGDDLMKLVSVLYQRAADEA